MKSTTIELALDGVVVMEGESLMVIHVIRIDHNKVYLRLVYDEGSVVSRPEGVYSQWSKVPVMGCEVTRIMR